MNTTLRFACAALALTLPVTAQGLTVGKTGGGIPGPSTFPLQGTAGDPYILLISGVERQTPLPGLGITLDIADDLADASATLPGFLGYLNGSGQATATLTLPDLPLLAGLTLSLQGVAGRGPYVVSNLVRVTPQVVGTFAPCREQPPVIIAGGGAVRAPDGSLLFVGGTGPVAQRYDPLREEWSAAGVTFGVGLLSQTTGLNDGRVLFTGGLGLDGQPTNAAAVYDPATQQTTTLTMGVARAGHGAALMGNGRVLITGGFEVFTLTDPLALFAGIRATTEVFDPVSNTFSPGPTMLEARALHSASTLRSGEVLVAGGLTLLPIVNIPTVSATAYRFNPSTGSFGLPALMNGSRFLHSAIGLDDGRVLLVGGLTIDLTAFLQSGNIADIIIGTRTDAQVYRSSLFGFGTFTTVAGMQEGRAGAALAALPGGGALAAGGFRVTINVPTSTFEIAATASADRFLTGPDRFAPTGSMAGARLFPLAVNLPDGTVMIVGGGPADAEIYQR
ncbi:MAG: hypothetical protein IPM29_22425 [Planctomycetes bacterium]|nr:hypothetical protein [Planctomycetota bacterium]